MAKVVWIGIGFILLALAVGIAGIAIFPLNSWYAPGLSDANRITLEIGLVAGAIAILAVGTAVCAIFAQRQTARAQATLAYLAKIEFDRDYINAKRKFLELAQLDGEISALAKVAPKPVPDESGPKSKKYLRELKKWRKQEKGRRRNAQKIRIVLSHFEIVSLGIQHRIIDYDLFERWNRATVLNIWMHAAPYVVMLRRTLDNPRLFIELEELAKYFQHQKPLRRRFK